MMTLLEKMDGETMDAFDECCCCCSEFGGLFLVSCFVVPMERSPSSFIVLIVKGGLVACLMLDMGDLG
jgi:hypothetical protein